MNGQIVKKDDRYIVEDDTSLRDLVVSRTILHAGKSTTGHSHKGQEEVYQFVSGYGTMIVGNDVHLVGPGDIVLIPDGAFHQVINSSHLGLFFVCVFDGKRYE